MANKEKLLLVATIYMLLPGAMPDVLADTADVKTPKAKKAATVHKAVAKKTTNQAAVSTEKKDIAK